MARRFVNGKSGDVLTWFGRDPEFEQKHKAWETTDKTEREPENSTW